MDYFRLIASQKHCRKENNLLLRRKLFLLVCLTNNCEMSLNQLVQAVITRKEKKSTDKVFIQVSRTTRNSIKLRSNFKTIKQHTTVIDTKLVLEEQKWNESLHTYMK